ncbi:hypothetical protein ROBYS_43930 [Roseobacter sp. OBYS 0001]|uniref:Uncharacterized protein n=1 Tax=Roseobacter litoralis (strain ATCC 49566 / DSM 6996 / JCM 21268 / NBRC 15278 / OCh 149) TaxID=391595 RepID=F7ZB05_ROSLO|nr:hypothetical protein RLO149_c036080 [Roseobacter litoralis Och 149]GIT89377.1 hypothetical protein ROBYS_43930 [Roseobacter sp. OBYS 0001]
MRRWVSLTVIALITLIFFYLSRFWYLNLWPRQGLLGIEELRPQGGLLARWLRGTDAAPYELLIWATAFFAVLSIAQKIYDRIPPREGE